MSEGKEKFKSWEEVIVDFFEHKVSASKLYKAREYIEKKNMEIKTGKDPKKLEILKRNQEKKQMELKGLRTKAPSTEIREWMDKTSKKNIAENNRIIKASHVLKFSHGSAGNEGLILGDQNQATYPLLTTSTTKKKLIFDVAHNNGNLITISRFLALSLADKMILDLILEGKFHFLEPFMARKEQYEKWEKGFKGLVGQREIKTANKSKQIYFPLSKNGREGATHNEKYHLLSPLFPSSLAEEIYSRISGLKFGKKQKEVRDCRGGNNSVTKGGAVYNPCIYIDHPVLAVQKFGGAQPQNISMLNKNRGGQSFLFSSQPPTWQTQVKPPVNKSSLFHAGFSHQTINTNIDYLREFLLRFDRIDLSVKHPQRRKWIEIWVGNITDELLFYAASIHLLPPGWSDVNDIKLKVAHQYFLDPYRIDESFQISRRNTDWQTVLCNDFAYWLNRRLIGKDKKFTPQKKHNRMWAALLETPLREYNQTIESDTTRFQCGEESI